MRIAASRPQDRIEYAKPQATPLPRIIAASVAPFIEPGAHRGQHRHRTGDVVAANFCKNSCIIGAIAPIQASRMARP
jgi:hypothetical protein